jgi:hypothetical protein
MKSTMVHVDDMEDFQHILEVLFNSSVCKVINITRPYIEKEQLISHFVLTGWSRGIKLWQVVCWSTNPVWRV